MLNKKGKKRKIAIIICSVILFLTLSGLFLLYGPITYFRDTIITTAMTTKSHQWIARLFYSDETIKKVMANNKVIEPEGSTDISKIKINKNVKPIYTTPEEETVLKRDPGNKLYKLVPIEEKISLTHYYKGFLLVIYDPSKISLASSKFLGQTGEIITTISKNNNAKVAFNASGFSDPEEHGNGGIPSGLVIEDSKIVWGNKSRTIYNVIGFNKDNILVLSRMTAEQAVNEGIRDAVDFGPFLIVNGEKANIKGNGGWGMAPRTAIGQRKDGIVLVLIIDGRKTESIGADMNDLTNLMYKYGAYNAANLDGGATTCLTENHKVLNKPAGYSASGLRRLPNAFIVTE